MLKKVVCMVILVMTILATVTVANVGAKQADIEEVGKNVEITCLMGDVDLDGKVTIKDASKIQKSSSGIINLSDRQIMASDVTDNTIIDVRDATTIQKFLAGVPCENCIGEVKVVQVMVDENGNIRWDDEEEFVGYPEELDVESIENAIEKRFLELVNEERAKVGVGVLSENQILADASNVRGEEIVKSFSHTRPDGTTCFTAIKEQKFISMGENIAYNGGLLGFWNGMSQEELEKEIDFAAQFAFGQFKSSPGHYKNMIKEDFNCTGVSVNLVISDGRTECYVAHMFGSI